VPWLAASADVDADAVAGIESAMLALGAVSVTLSDSGDNPVYQLQPGVTDLWPGVKLTGLFPAELAVEPIRAALLTALGASASQQLVLAQIDDRDWTRVWMEDFHAMQFGRRLWVVPCAQDAPDEAEIILRLDPGLAFGSGTHATTRLCLEWLEARKTTLGRVVDYGCGSGILSVAAALLGADSIEAIDHDPQAITATVENARINGVADRIHAGFHVQGTGDHDLVLANILARPLCHLAPQLAALNRGGGRVLLSGILLDQVDALLAVYERWFNRFEQCTMDEWVLITAHRNDAPVED